MAPAQQRFRTDDIPGNQVDLGLEMKHEVPARNRVAQAVDELEPLGDRRIHPVFVEADAVRPLRLGVVHRGVRGARQALGLLGISRKKSGANARSDPAFRPVQDVALADLATDVFGTPGGGVGIFDPLHRHHELVSAEPSHQVALASRSAQTFRDLLEQGIARRVTQVVVDRLEAVEVEEEKADAGSVPLGILKRQFQTSLKRDAIR